MQKITPELNLSNFKNDPILIKKLIRAKEHFEKNTKIDDADEYILENDKFETVYADGSGTAKIANDTKATHTRYRSSKKVVEFRPAFSLHNNKLDIYTAKILLNREDPPHIIPVFESAAWTYCDGNYNSKTKRCLFTPFDVNTAKILESQYQYGKKTYKFSMVIDNKEISYTVYPTSEGEVFIQINDDDTSIQNHILRIPNKEARELTAKNDIEFSISGDSGIKLLMGIILNTRLNINEIDDLYYQGTYKSKNYQILLEQDKIFEEEYGFLSRADVYHILSYYDAHDTGVSIDLDRNI